MCVAIFYYMVYKHFFMLSPFLQLQRLYSVLVVLFIFKRTLLVLEKGTYFLVVFFC